MVIETLKGGTQPQYQRRSACPICGNDSAQSTPAVSSRPSAEKLAPDQLGKFLSDYDAERVFFTYHACSSCGAYFCPVYFSQDQLDGLYADQPENMLIAPPMARIRTQEHYLSILLKRAELSGRYLEIGADIGLFAELCAKAGSFDDLLLYEPNRTIHDGLRARTESWNTEIRSESFERGHVAANSVSVAVMIHVLDHILEPESLLSDIFASLAPGGVLFLVTHNRASLLARLLGKRWPPYTMQHPHLFTPATMRHLVERVGFRDVTFYGTRNSFPATYFVKAGLATLGMGRIPFPSTHKPVISLPLGNIATIAHKPDD